jgi:hypothetical protein
VRSQPACKGKSLARSAQNDGSGWGLDTPFGHGDFFTWKGDWYHVWCKYRDRSHDRIRDCFIARVVYGEDGSMRNVGLE